MVVVLVSDNDGVDILGCKIFALECQKQFFVGIANVQQNIGVLWLDQGAIAPTAREPWSEF